MKKTDKFLVESLHRRKLILATEAVMVNTSVGLGIYLVERFVSSHLLADLLILTGAVFGIGYSLWVAGMNIRHHMQIRSVYKNE